MNKWWNGTNEEIAYWVTRTMSLKDWIPEKDVDFFGLKISEDEKRGWLRGRKSLCDWYSQRTLLERLKLAFRGYLIDEFKTGNVPDEK